MTIVLSAVVVTAALTFTSQQGLALDYRDLQRTYAAGQWMEVAAIAAAYTPESLELIERLWATELGNRSLQPSSPRLRTAAMLHTDAAIQLFGRPDEYDIARRHLTLARTLVSSAHRSAEDQSFFRRWSLAAGVVLHRLNLHADAERELERSLEVFPNNSSILLELAAVYMSWSRTTGEMGTEKAVETRVRGMLLRSEQLLRRARAVDDANPEIAIRLGHVCFMLGRRMEAATLLAGLDARRDDQYSYLQELLLGHVMETSEPQEAARHYQAAIDRCPTSQAAYVALAKVQRRLGDFSAAAASIETMLKRQAAATEDPWLRYSSSQLLDLDGLLQQLRGTVASR